MYRLHKGNNLTILKTFEDNTFDMIFADPPYFLSNGGTTCKNGKNILVNKGDWDKSKGFEEDYLYQKQWLKECKRVLKETGTIWVSGTYHSIFSVGFALQELKYKILNDIIWFKPNASPNLARKTYTASHETLIWASKSKDYYFNYEASCKYFFEKDKIKNPGKQMRSVWWLSTTPRNEKKLGYHPTQKPLSLLERIILTASKEGDLILDPFCGSGTTGVAAVKNNRSFVGIDISEEYLELTKNRIKEVSNEN